MYFARRATGDLSHQHVALYATLCLQAEGRAASVA